jgi:long-chain fatty acid transport protein
MKTPNFRRHHVAAAVAGAVLALGATQAPATGFQLNEQSASGIGNAFAGGAAFTDDISAMWWNPAVLSKFERRQFVQGLHVVVPKIEFNNDGSVPATNQPLGGNGGDAGGWNFIPNLYFSMPINDQFAFGLGVNGPFGNKTQYSEGWLGRYQALDSKIITINVNPAISWKVTPEFSVGAGVNFQYIDGEFTQNANYSGSLAAAAVAAAQGGAIPPSLVPQIVALTPGLDSHVTIKGDDTAWGWNIGAAWDVTPQWRLAAAYRSEIKYKLKGNVDFDNPTISGIPPTLAPVVNQLAAAVNGPPCRPTALGCIANYDRSVTSDITLPQIANLSAVWKFDRQWEFMADAQWTGWSSITDLTFVPTDGSDIPGVPLEWDDSWKFAVGASYRYNEQWKARFGVAFDQTPVTTHPTARLPDSDRWWLAVGGEYRWTREWKFDAGLVYIKGDSAEFDQRFSTLEAGALGQIRGSYDASVWILSAQAAYVF